MRSVAKGFLLIRLSILAFLASATAVRAEDGKGVRIDAIQPGLSQGVLTVSAVMHGLFSPRIVGTIQSGLPSMVEIEVKVVQAGKKSRFRRRFLRTISYNIWDERYVVQSEDTVVTLRHLAEVERWISRIESLRLIAATSLAERVRYTIQLRVHVIPISVRQGVKVLDWLQEASQTEEDLASEDRSSGFRFNLSRLVSLFVGGNKGRQNRSPWYSSPAFRISDLKR